MRNPATSLCVLLLCAFVFTQLPEYTDYNRIHEISVRKCNNNDATCYDYVPWVDSLFRYSRSYVNRFGYYRDRNYCSSTVLTTMNTTCSELFCSTPERSLNRLMVNSTTNLAFARYIFAHAVCYYCNTTDRKQFREKLSNNECPTYWKHDPNYCGQGDEMLVSYLLLESESYKYLDRVKQTNRSLNLDLSTVQGLMNLTIIRNQRQDHIGEAGRGELMYSCYCSATQRWGLQCDVWTNVMYPFYREVLPYIAISLKTLFALIYLILVLVPKNWASIARERSNHGQNIVRALFRALVTQLDALASTITFASICFSIIVELVAIFNQNLSLIFNGITYVLFGMCAILLLIQWAHIYDCSSELMMADSSLSKKNKAIMIIMIILLSLLLVTIIIGTIIGDVLDRYTDVSADIIINYLRYFNSSLFILGVVITTGFMIGFLVYGLRMFLILRAVNKVSLFQVKITRMMIIVDLSFLYFMIWMGLFSYTIINRDGFGPFMSLFMSVFVDVSLFISFFSIGMLLFNWDNTKKTYKFIDPCLAKLTKCLPKKRKTDEETGTTRYYRMDDNVNL